MRISNEHWACDMRSFHLATRMLLHDARTHSVCTWTGLSAERVHQLLIVQRRESGLKGARRYRGPCPTDLRALLSSASLRSEAAVAAYACQLLDVIPAEPVANARATLPSVPRGERLCSALERFRTLVPHARLSLDQLILVVVTLAEGAEWTMNCCRRCSAVMLVDRLSVERTLCERCQQEAHQRGPRAAKARIPGGIDPAERKVRRSEGEQLELFSDLKDTEDSS